jgi:type IV pilus assembly protein PilQ
VNCSIRSFFVIICFLCCTQVVTAQDRFVATENKLKELAVQTPGLNEKVELSVNGVSIQEFVRGIAIANNVNISIDPAINVKVFNNFSNVTVAEVFLFLAKKFDLEVTFIGSIINFSQYVAPIPEPVKAVAKKIAVDYDEASNKLTLDLKNDSLAQVAKQITRVSGKNVVLAPDVINKLVSVYIQGMPFANAIDKFAFANDLKASITTDNFYLLEKKTTDQPAAAANASTSSYRNRGNATGNTSSVVNNAQQGFPGLTIKVDNDQIVSIDALNVPIVEIVGSVSDQLKKNYFLFADPKGNTTLHIDNVSYEDLLKYLLSGTDFTFRNEKGIYLIGERQTEGFRDTRVVELKYRTVEKITDFVPTDLKKGVELKIFSDLNSVILSGSSPVIAEIEAFLHQIDQVVPVILIEILIADVRDTRSLSTGIEAGLDKPKATSGKLYPDVALTLSSRAINDLISGLNGFGAINLGNVTPNFYLSLKALDQRGIIKMRSTPKLATLNGHEAQMSIGQTQYYLERSNNVIGSQNPQNIITEQYKSVNADLAVNINPIVSGDEQITLTIGVKQSSFTERVTPNAPPGTLTKDFKSLIRVKNGEMIILGGLLDDTKSDSGSGLPLLSRIPIIKWLFSSRTKSRSTSKLTLFVRATIIR